MTKSLKYKFLSISFIILTAITLSGCGLKDVDKGSNKTVNPTIESFKDTPSSEQSVNDVKSNTDTSEEALEKDLNTIESELNLDLSLDGLE